jgi:FtsP/CotA-like multicopper oxidase with cupredoxin domain
MKHPGVWVLGDLDDDDRGRGMGIVVEYVGHKGGGQKAGGQKGGGGSHKGKPLWARPKPFRWDYASFGQADAAAPPVDETIEMTIVKHNGALDGFNQWTINGDAFSMGTMQPRFTLHEGRRYRLKLRNAADDVHPMHLHRHSFELTRIGGKPTRGVIKDVVMLGGFQEAEIDFVADNPGPTLFHCHQQLHMDFGLMALFDYA